MVTYQKLFLKRKAMVCMNIHSNFPDRQWEHFSEKGEGVRESPYGKKPWVLELD